MMMMKSDLQVSAKAIRVRKEKKVKEKGQLALAHLLHNDYSRK